MCMLVTSHIDRFGHMSLGAHVLLVLRFQAERVRINQSIDQSSSCNSQHILNTVAVRLVSLKTAAA